jgi:hypothetical protein
MTLCPNCGAEVESGDDCPRCGAPIAASRKAKALALASAILGAVFGLGASVLMIVDFAINGSFGWSLIGLASGVEAWLLIGLPMLEYRKPGLFLSVMGVSALAYLWALERLAGGSWFLPLALPIAISAFVSAALSALLCLKASSRGPNIGAYILLGCTLAALAVENILSLHLAGRPSFTWSAIVAASALPTALLLLGIHNRVRSRA